MVIIDRVERMLGLSTGDTKGKEKDTMDKDDSQSTTLEAKEQVTAKTTYSGSNVIDANFNNSTNPNNESPLNRGTLIKSKITTIKPKDFHDAQTVANSLRDGVPVIMNFEETDTEAAKRIIDFISGTTYAINGIIKKVSQDVFVCAPPSVTVTYTDESKKPSGKFFE